MSIATKTSDTAIERFYHVSVLPPGNGARPHIRATVFFREEANTGLWAASVAVTSPSDNFSREVGRNVSRRKYFNGDYQAVPAPSYDLAVDLAKAAAERTVFRNWKLVRKWVPLKVKGDDGKRTGEVKFGERNVWVRR